MRDELLTLRVESGSDRVSVFRTGAATPILVQNAPADARPFIHPILVPGGTSAVTEDAPDHHPWQHGLYIGLNDVNGVGFWTEGLAPDRAALDGTFHPRIAGLPLADRDTATWEVATEYWDREGRPVFRDSQAWMLKDRGDWYELDLVWALSADDLVTFGAHEYGGLFLRMPFRPQTGGHAITSSGLRDGEAEGRRARWVAVQMPVHGHEGEVQVAVLDHPDNLQHPVPWRVDHELGVGPSPSIAGPWTIGPGERRVFRYRLLVLARPASEHGIDEAWASFSQEGPA